MKKSLAERLRDAISGTAVAERDEADDLEKARRPLPMKDEDDDGEPDDNPPSDEDRDNDAAPDKAAPPEDGDDDDRGAGDDDEDDDEGKAPPAGGDDDDEEDDDDDDKDDLRKKILQRSQEDPDFFKSLAASPEGREAMKLIEASDAVAFMCQTFSEIVDGMVRQNVALQKSLDDRLAAIESDNEVIAEALEKSLLLTGDLVKSLGEQNDIIKSQGRRDSGRVGHGFGGSRAPERIDPLGEKKREIAAKSEAIVLTAEERAAALKRKMKVQMTLWKSVNDEVLSGDTGGNLLRKIGTPEGIVEVERYLEEHNPDIFKSLTA